jgi:hypothetical protein
MRWDTGQTIPGRAAPVARGQFGNPAGLLMAQRPGRWLAGRDGARAPLRLCAFAAADCSIAAAVLQIAALRAYVRQSAAVCCSSTNVL